MSDDTNIISDLVATVESLKVETARLRTELEQANRMLFELGSSQNWMEQANRERDLAQARNEKLERALETISAGRDTHSGWAAGIAKEALAACEEKPGVPKAE